MDLTPTSLFGLLTLVADIYAIVKIVDSSASTGRKVAWIVGVVVFPIIGVIAWWFMGPKR